MVSIIEIDLMEESRRIDYTCVECLNNFVEDPLCIKFFFSEELFVRYHLKCFLDVIKDIIHNGKKLSREMVCTICGRKISENSLVGYTGLSYNRKAIHISCLINKLLDVLYLKRNKKEEM